MNSSRYASRFGVLIKRPLIRVQSVTLVRRGVIGRVARALIRQKVKQGPFAALEINVRGGGVCTFRRRDALLAAR